MASFAAKTASPTCSAAENVTLPKEQTGFRSMRFRSEKCAGDITGTLGGSSSGRNRTVRAGLSSKPPWAPLCNRQLSNYIIIVCNYFISSNDRSPPNLCRREAGADPAVNKQAFRNRIPSRPISRDHAAALIQLSITQQKSTRIFFSAIPLRPRLVLILLQQPP